MDGPQALTRKLNSFLAFASVLAAAVVPSFTAGDLIARSEVIVEGKITRRWVAWDASHRYLWTHYSFAVSDRLRGSEATVTVSEPGGSLNGVNQGASGAMTHAVGERAVLFLYRTPIGFWRVAGGPQGSFTVNTEGRVHAGTAIPGLEGLTLEEFKARVRRLGATHSFRKELP